MEIPDKYTKLIGKRVYNRADNRIGHISEMRIAGSYFMCMYYNVFYDKFDDEAIMTLDAFFDGLMQFVIVTGTGLKQELEEKANERILQDIQDAFGEKFSEDMIKYMDGDEHDRLIKQKEKEKIRCIGVECVSLSELSEKIFYDDFYCQKLWSKYRYGVISETEMLYGVCNHLCNDLDRLKQKELEYFAKYELRGLVKDAIENVGDMFDIDQNIFENGEEE